MQLSVVIISRNEGPWLRRTFESLQPTVPADTEVIVVDDGSTDSSAAGLHRMGIRLLRTRGIGVARARNYGGRRASGDVLIFLDGHMQFAPGWWEPLVDVLHRRAAGSAAPAIADVASPHDFGYGFSLPHPTLKPQWLSRAASRPFHAPVLPGACLAIPRTVFHAVGGFDHGLRARGGVDIETSLRLWLLGYENWIVPSSRVWHLFRKAAPYPVPQADAVYNRLRLAFSHLRGSRIAKVIAAHAGEPALPHALRLLLRSDAVARRRELFRARTRNDNWFFRKFGIVW
ncbi:MAG: glycosyltransferase [Bryobacteraceae bacterium]|nr:glycosyltransferase [Bryobacteraceae bacterium]